VSPIQRKHLRIHLGSVAYQRLRQEVLARDNWRCQQCGARQNLQVHHLAFRCQSGDDSEPNLITLCQECHAHMHGQFRSSRAKKS